MIATAFAWRRTWGLLAAATACLVGVSTAAGQTPTLPVQVLESPSIARPVDHVFAGTIELDVEQADVAHKLFVVRERIPVQRAGAITLLYPRWEAASHGPSLSVVDLAGLQVEADGRPLAWRRNPRDPHAFDLEVPAGTQAIEVRFQIVGADDELSPDLVVVPWQRLILYPAGWYARNLTIAATVTFPAGLQPFTSLVALDSRDGRSRFAPVSLETLLDAPVYAARHARQLSLSALGPATVSVDLIARRPDDLAVAPERIEALSRMVEQAGAVFGAAPFGHYAFLARMEDDGSAGGTEHRRSSEISLPSSYFSDWEGQLNNRDILAHEFVHAWNGLYRSPADLWTPTPNEPQGGSLLWVYEGQTEFWGRVLAARSGLRTREETLDKLALDAAEIANRPGRAWRSLSDDVNYPAFMLRKAVPWRDWQRRRDYYLEGVLLWLDVDALLREQSGGRRGIDDFARIFFAGAAPDAPTRTYVFDDVAKALNAVAPYDWARFLRRWLDGHAELDVSAGLARQGWRLAYSDTATAAYRQNEKELDVTDLSYSIGLTVADSGLVRSIAWDGPAYRAGIGPKTKIVSIGGAPFTCDGLIEAVRHAASAPISVTFEQDGRTVARTLDYRGTLRYPHLERIAGQPDRLGTLFAPRQK
ncbi:M61 family peptidase [Xanthomonas sp. NCPPB 2654]|uniref:M61 family metallopeptidase n=1 Tax=unclassified Xanthomonas TaxID=2643310 RepID=UPI0021DF8645|nr:MULTISPECIES: M61 family peptidase [unclassified Xanthomonas]MDL5364817.1 M61 family peptidase [Xanthomonas sp. NCPPB 2654]UYC18842.1 M61 family peptidase [Xanthomonas sp. CFBP 8443]